LTPSVTAPGDTNPSDATGADQKTPGYSNSLVQDIEIYYALYGKMSVVY